MVRDMDELFWEQQDKFRRGDIQSDEEIDREQRELAERLQRED